MEFSFNTAIYSCTSFPFLHHHFTHITISCSNIPKTFFYNLIIVFSKFLSLNSFPLYDTHFNSLNFFTFHALISFSGRGKEAHGFSQNQVRQGHQTRSIRVQSEGAIHAKMEDGAPELLAGPHQAKAGPNIIIGKILFHPVFILSCILVCLTLLLWVVFLIFALLYFIFLKY